MKIKPLYEQVLNESISGKHLVVVDVQPEYEDSFGRMSQELAEFINENFIHVSRLTFLYNGADTLGMIDIHDYQNWWLEEGLEPELAYDSHYYDKGYAFFRYCIDEGIDDDQITNLVREMYSRDIRDSRQLDEEFWNEFVNKYGDEDIRELIEFSDDALWLPDLMEEMSDYSNIVLCGGGINECLKEVEIALDALGKSYTTLDRFTY